MNSGRALLLSGDDNVVETLLATASTSDATVVRRLSNESPQLFTKAAINALVILARKQVYSFSDISELFTVTSANVCRAYAEEADPATRDVLSKTIDTYIMLMAKLLPGTPSPGAAARTIANNLYSLLRVHVTVPYNTTQFAVTGAIRATAKTSYVAPESKLSGDAAAMAQQMRAVLSNVTTEPDNVTVFRFMPRATPVVLTGDLRREVVQAMAHLQLQMEQQAREQGFKVRPYLRMPAAFGGTV